MMMYYLSMNKVIIGVVAVMVVIGLIVFKAAAKPNLPLNTSRIAEDKALSPAGTQRVNIELDTTSGDQAQTDTAVSQQFTGKKLATNYFEYTKEDYDRLRTAGQPFLLYFYANWCPTCAVQELLLTSFMNKGASNGKVTLRVNYNDSDTDSDEKELANKFTITYQHTFVTINSNGQEVTRVNGQQSETDLQNLFSKI